MNLIDPPSLFCFKNKLVVYPPFKNGRYMEEYFFDFMKKNKLKYDKNGRLYIPAFWTNFQIESWFESDQHMRELMQLKLDNYILENPNPNGYFIVVQHDNGPALKLPENTILYGACFGDIPLPLIYEDNNKSLEKMDKKGYYEKEIFCSFVGSDTHQVRVTMMDVLSKRDLFVMNQKQYWSIDVSKEKQDRYIKQTIESRFALAPRGYGRSSFRFFEIYKLGAIPVYIWDDIEWLPYKDVIDYSKICVSIHISQINSLENILLNIDEEKYSEMWREYEKVKHLFDLEYMCEYITGFTNTEKEKMPISLCIPTMDRFDEFLDKYLHHYFEYLKDGIIDEIIISDENGNDYEKIMNKYGDYICNHDNFRIYKNEKKMGVFLNKMKVCSYSRNELIALIDSDNFAPKDYFLNINKYIFQKWNKEIPKHFILSPSFARPPITFKALSGDIITRENIKSSFEKNNFEILLNTGNYIITKSIIENIK